MDKFDTTEYGTGTPGSDTRSQETPIDASSGTTPIENISIRIFKKKKQQNKGKGKGDMEILSGESSSGSCAKTEKSYLEALYERLRLSDEYRAYKNISMKVGKKWAKSHEIYDEYSSNIYVRYGIGLEDFSQRSLHEQNSLLNSMPALSHKDRNILEQYSGLVREIASLKNQLESKQEYRDVADRICAYNDRVSNFNAANPESKLPELSLSESIQERVFKKDRKRQADTRYFPYLVWLEITQHTYDSQTNKRIENVMKKQLIVKRQKLESSVAYQSYKKILDNLMKMELIKLYRYSEYPHYFTDGYQISIDESEQLSSAEQQEQLDDRTNRLAKNRGRLWTYSQIHDRIREYEDQLKDEQKYGGIVRRVEEFNEKAKEFNKYNPGSIQELPLRDNCREKTYELEEGRFE